MSDLLLWEVSRELSPALTLSPPVSCIICKGQTSTWRRLGCLTFAFSNLFFSSRNPLIKPALTQKSSVYKKSRFWL